MWRAGRTERAAHGFTLVEVLVALAVFAVASMIAYKGLNAVTGTKATLDREIRFWHELGLVFDRMESDFLQIAPQAWVTDAQSLAPPLRANPIGESGFAVEFTRQDSNRPTMRIAYQCQNGRLALLLLPSGSGASREEATSVQSYPMLADIERCEAAYLDVGNVWRSVWPLDRSAVKPRAIRVRLALAGHGVFERIYYLP